VKRIVVAIDGPAGAGKSTVTRRLARALGYQLLDTGALYRLIALVGARQGVSFDDEAGLAAIARALGTDVAFRLDGEQNQVFWQGVDVSQDIRSPAMSEGASRVSQHPRVRAGLLELQRELGGQGGVVAEGRDIGTVVFPDAEAKFFLTAAPEVRARRRHEELQASGSQVSYEDTLADVIRRDERDSSRAVAPLARAADAILVDSSTISIEEVVETMLRTVRSREV
jgi:cytidylate kinase